MPFLSEGLGPARDNFSTNLAGLKNLRQRMAVMHERETETLKEARDAFTRTVRAARSPIAIQHLWWGGEDYAWALEFDAERLEEEQRTTREIMLTYIITALDEFFGRWRQENKLSTGWPPAVPSEIEAAWRGIARKRRDKTMALKLIPHFRDRLLEIRARRAVIVHRGGIADKKYCGDIGNHAVLGQRLLVDDAYLDPAVDFVDELTGAMAARVYSGHQSATDAATRSALIARMFA